MSALAVALLCGCATHRSNPDTSLERFEFAQAQMGLEFRMTLYAPTEPEAIEAVAHAFARIAELNAVLSDYDSDSELSRLSRSSGTDSWIAVSDDLWTILETGQQLSEQTDGAFDLTIGPSVNLWRRARRREALPDPKLLSAMRARVGYQNLELDPASQSARLKKENMRLDAGGIAKGFAMDEALSVLREHGIEHAMIHGGGDMVLGAPPPGKTGWRVELTEPDTTTLLLSRAALATSGDLVQNLKIDGIRYSHIIDPRTGIGLTNRSLVHVIAPDGMTADSLSTTLNILGEKEARKLLREYPTVEARISSATESGPVTWDTKGFATHAIKSPQP